MEAQRRSTSFSLGGLEIFPAAPEAALGTSLQDECKLASLRRKPGEFQAKGTIWAKELRRKPRAALSNETPDLKWGALRRGKVARGLNAVSGKLDFFLTRSREPFGSEA